MCECLRNSLQLYKRHFLRAILLVTWKISRHNVVTGMACVLVFVSV